MIAIVGTPVVASSGSASASTLDSPALSTTNGNSLIVGCASQEGDFVGPLRESYIVLDQLVVATGARIAGWTP